MLGTAALSGLGRGLKFDEAWSGREMSYFGFISPDGETGLSVVLDWALGICAASEHKEACWDFISYLLTDAPEGLATHSLPLYRPAFEQMLRDGIGDSPCLLYTSRGRAGPCPACRAPGDTRTSRPAQPRRPPYTAVL